MDLSKEEIAIASVGLFTGFVIGMVLMTFIMNSGWKQAAVDHNVAEWRLDEKTGWSSWHWKEQPTSIEKK